MRVNGFHTFVGIFGTGAVLLLALCGYGLWYTFSDAAAPERAKFAAAQAAEAQPHVIKQVDGCKVYAWKGDSGRYHFFTRCPGSATSTETNWQECRTEPSGKTTTRRCENRQEVITNE